MMFRCNNYDVITVTVHHVLLEVGQTPDFFERFGYKWNKSPIFAEIQKNEFKQKTRAQCHLV